MHTWLRWALGDLGAVPAPAREVGALPWTVVGACSLAVLFGLVFDPALHPVVRGVSHLVLYGLLPVGLLALAGERDLAAWGLGLGDVGWWLPRTGLGLLLIGAFASTAMLLFPDLAAFYPRGDARHDGTALLVSLAGLSIDLLGWEMLFRAVLLGAFARKLEVRTGLALAALLFFVGHLDKPLSELFSSLPGGFVAGWFAWRSRSFLPVYLLHLWQLVTVNAVGFVLAQTVTPGG